MTIADQTSSELTLTVDRHTRPAPPRPPHHPARRPARAPRPDRHQEGLRPRAVRGLHGPDRRARGSNSCLQLAVAAAGREITTIEGVGRRRTICTRSSGRSSTSTASSAATAPRARSARPSRCSASRGAAGRAPSTEDVAAGGRARHARTREEIRERMSGNLCRCGAYVSIVEAVARRREAARSPTALGSTGPAPRTGGGGMREFGYERAYDVSGRRRPAAAPTPTRAILGGGTNLVDLMKTGVERPARARRRHGNCRSTGSSHARTAACASARPSPTATSPPTPTCGAATRRWPRPCWPGPPGSCATWPRSAATCSSAPAAATSPTWPSPATSGSPAAAARPSRASTTTTRSSAPPTHCVATHPSDMGVALAAFDAVVHRTKRPTEPGELPLADFYLPRRRHPAPGDRAAARRADHRRHPAARPGRRPSPATARCASARRTPSPIGSIAAAPRRPRRCRTRGAARLRRGGLPAVAGPRRPSGC